MRDLISRQAAIDALRKLREEDIEDYGCEIPEGFNQDHLDRATFAIKQLPPIRPKRGKWILDRSGAYCCSECMEPCATYVMMKPRDKFCKMCGSRNEVTE